MRDLHKPQLTSFGLMVYAKTFKTNCHLFTFILSDTELQLLIELQMNESVLS